MAFDGLTVSCIAHELNNKLINGRIFKIAQPESDELYITIKINKKQYKLLISANASIPLVYLTSKPKQSPLTAPSFCMLLRKYINNGRIVKIYQPGLERIINIEIEHLNEMGDLCRKTLIAELMGKHSNIIFTDENNNILDSIKHVSARTSSVREVLPGRNYFIPNTTDKLDPLNLDFPSFKKEICSKPDSLSRAILSSYTGISPVVGNDIVNLSGLDSSMTPSDLNDDEIYHLYNIFSHYMDDIKSGNYSPVIYYDGKEPKDYSSIPLSVYSDLKCVKKESISTLLEDYYSERESIQRMKQRSSDLRTVVNSTLSKCNKKYNLQLKQLKDTEKRDKYKVYGELITTYGYSLTEEDKVLKCINYYDNKEISIPIDNQLSPIDNAKKYFDKYQKLKRTYEALSKITLETATEIEHLESISTALSIATSVDDLKQIKEELINFGYIKRKSNEKRSNSKSKPIHIKLDDFHEIYIGKNNYQNEEVSFKIATGNDWWFHAKKMPGSHIIVKSSAPDESSLPDNIYEIAGSLAAYYSKGRENEKVEIDYTQKKNLKRVAGAAPGFVIYHTNFSMVSEPKSIEQLKLNC